MNQVINVIVCVCVLSIGAFGVRAESTKLIPPAPALPIPLATVGHIQVMRHDLQPHDNRLVLELRNPDVTAMPSRSTLHVSFDARIVDVTAPTAPMPLQLETAVTSQQLTFFLARDPFASSQPWSYTVTIAFNQLPQTGAVALGDLPPQPLTYASPSPAVQVNVQVTTLPGT